MKTKQIIKITLSLLLLVATFTACVEDKDFDTPQVSCDEDAIAIIPASSMTTIQNAVANYTGGLSDFAAENEDAVYMEGYVSSNDLKGNFYKELFIQDKLEDPDYAVKLAIDIRGLYTKYTVGSKIVVKLNGLSIDNSHGEMTIGENIGGALDEIRENIALSHIMRDCNSHTIVPVELNSANGLNVAMLGKLIKLTDVQFHVDAVGLPFVDPNDGFDTHREIVFCEDVSAVKLESSSFAAYANTVLQSSKMNVTGILSRDYGDDFYVLKISSPEDIETLSTPRCDPLFLEGFSGGFGDWTTYSVTGNQVWEIDPTFGNPGSCAKMSGFAGGAQTNEDWLISPAIDLSATVNPTLTFQSARNYSGPDLEVFTSSDYIAGQDPTTSGSWTQETVNLSSGSWSWESSGNIDISSYVGGDVYVAFKYISGSGAATYEIDNVSIKEQ